ncbi:unnamed protein product, partial [Musa hybrid cultivar]
RAHGDPSIQPIDRGLQGENDCLSDVSSRDSGAVVMRTPTRWLHHPPCSLTLRAKKG